MPMPSDAPVMMAQLPLDPNLESYCRQLGRQCRAGIAYWEAWEDKETGQQAEEAEEFDRDVDQADCGQE